MNPQQQLDALAGLALFSDLERPQLQAVAHTMTEESFPAGQRIPRQGFSGTGFFNILEGDVVVRVEGGDVATLGKGDFFGEISVIRGGDRTASVRTIGDVELLRITSRDLREFMEREPKVAESLERAATERTEESEQLIAEGLDLLRRL